MYGMTTRIRWQYLKGVDEHYEIGVPTELFEQARSIIKKGPLT